MTMAATTLPAHVYRDPSRWPLERDRVFARSWLFAGHESDAPTPGAWRADVVAGFPILLLRDERGALRAFHNVCRHRAGPLTEGERGVCDGEIRCRYHGWRYALDGRLKNARDFGPAPDFDPREFSLIALRVERWRGLVFVAISDDAPAFPEVVAPLDRRLGDRNWIDHRVALRRAHVLDCNWKTYAENYLEGYHVSDVHPGLDAEIDAARYRAEMDGRVAIHAAPTKDPQAVYEGLWAWFWPNLGVNVYAKGLMMERMTPLGHDRTRLDYVFLTPPGETLSAQTLAMSEAVTAEDKRIVERVQENLNAGIYDAGRLSPRHEACVAAFQAMVRAACDDA